MKRIVSSFGFVFIAFFCFAQNVGIGTTSPNNSAVLDLQSTDKGVLVPRIALTAVNTATPVNSPANGLLVYNLATAGVGNNAVTPGFYYWNAASSKWVRITTNENAWGDGVTSTLVGGFIPTEASDGEDKDDFGKSVSISGNWAIIGAPSDRFGTIYQGSAYLYFFDGNTWVEKQKLTRSTNSASGFGYSVSISGNWAIVGAPFDYISASQNPGIAYVYHFNGTNWIEFTQLTSTDGVAGDLFGVCVSIESNTIVIGAPDANKLGPNRGQGAVYVFILQGGAWIQKQKITAGTNADAGDNFGGSISLSGDFAIIGSALDNVGSNRYQGSAYILEFDRTASVWYLKQKLIATDGVGGEEFGFSVSISGNYALVGAPGADINGRDVQGAAYIYFFNGTLWIQQQKLIATDGDSDDLFGYSVSISGDYAIVSSNEDDIAANNDQGSAYVFKRNSTDWKAIQKISNPAGNESDKFGIAVTQNNKRFVIGESANLQRGRICFGKIN